MAVPVHTAQVGDPGLAWDIHVVEQGIRLDGTAAVALDPQDEPHIVYATSDGLLRHATRVAGAWTVRTITEAGLPYGAVGLAIDGNETLHVSYFDMESGRVAYARGTGASWTTAHLEASLGEGYSDIALDPEGIPHIVYVSRGGVLRHGYRNETAWVLETVDADVVTARYPSLAITSGGSPEVAYYANGRLLYAKWIGYRWTITSVDNDSNPQFIGLGLDRDDMPRIGYRDELHKEVRFAAWNGSAWSREVVDSGGDPGWDAGLALDSTGAPQLAYYERVSGFLKHASKVNGEWVTRIVDLAPVSGWYGSITVGNDTRPHLAYFSWSDTSIRYAEGGFSLQVRTWPASAITDRSATLRAELTSIDQEASVRFSIEWRLPGGGWQTLRGTNMTSPGFMEAWLDGLEQETRYEFRGVAVGAESQAEGEIRSFATAETPPPTWGPLQLGILTASLVAAAVVPFLWSWTRRRRRTEGGGEGLSEPGRSPP